RRGPTRRNSGSAAWAATRGERAWMAAKAVRMLMETPQNNTNDRTYKTTRTSVHLNHANGEVRRTATSRRSFATRGAGARDADCVDGRPRGPLDRSPRERSRGKQERSRCLIRVQRATAARHDRGGARALHGRGDRPRAG